MDRKKIKTCPMCSSQKIEHKFGDHGSIRYGTTPNVPQSVCHNCKEIFLGPDSLEVIRSNKVNTRYRLNTII